MSRSRLGDWLRLVRASNFPTVVSNALTGCALGALVPEPYPWRAFFVAAPALVLIYAAGIALNDALDAEIDRAERPDRPIPAGRIGGRSALLLAGVLNLAGLGLLGLRGLPGAAVGTLLVACAFGYNLLHRAHAASVILMGVCRALAILTAAATVAWPLEWDWAVPTAMLLGLYVVGLSIVARSETADRRRLRIVILMVCSISLLDAAFLTVLGRWPQALLALGCFGVALLGQRRIIGT